MPCRRPGMNDHAPVTPAKSGQHQWLYAMHTERGRKRHLTYLLSHLSQLDGDFSRSATIAAWRVSSVGGGEESWGQRPGRARSFRGGSASGRGCVGPLRRRRDGEAKGEGRRGRGRNPVWTPVGGPSGVCRPSPAGTRLVRERSAGRADHGAPDRHAAPAPPAPADPARPRHRPALRRPRPTPGRAVPRRPTAAAAPDPPYGFPAGGTHRTRYQGRGCCRPVRGRCGPGAVQVIPADPWPGGRSAARWQSRMAPRRRATPSQAACGADTFRGRGAPLAHPHQRC